MRFPLLPRIATTTALLALACALPAAAQTQRYGYYRVVDGSANLVQDGSTVALQENHPLVTGDRLWTGGGSRVEVELPDGTLVRLGGQAEVSFDELAGSGDTGATSTLLFLQEGELQVVTESTFGVEAYPRIDTPNASVYLEGAGSYRIDTRGDETRVAVRSGSAEVRTREDVGRLGPDQEAWVGRGDRVAVQAAAGWSELERWGASLDEQVRRADLDGSVDGRLRYGASRLGSYGSWVDVDRRRAWRPRVGADWSPYRHGRWVYTPSGLTWASYEPWGWVPYHYGSWDYAPSWGWVWYPGAVYAPAWVYWYWGPSHVGWAPVGYYYRHYGPRYYGHYGWDYGHRFRFGVHGWAGGRFNHWDRWNFVDCRRIGDPRLAHHTRSAAQLGGQLGELPRGIIATDTRGLRTAIATRPSAAMRELEGRREGINQLPDLTRFIARDPDVPRDVARAALPVDPQGVAAPGRDGRGHAWEKPIVAPGGREARGSVPGDAIEARPRDAQSPAAGGAGRGTVSRTRPRGEAGGASQPATPAPSARAGAPGQRGLEEKPQAAPRRPPGRGEWSPPETSSGAEPATPSARTRPPAARGAAPAARPDAGGAATTKPRATAPPPGASLGEGAGARTQPRSVPAPRTSPRTAPPASRDDDGAAARRRAAPPSDGGGGRELATPPASRSYDSPGARRIAPPQSAPQRSVPPVRRVVEGVRRPEPPSSSGPAIQQPSPRSIPSAGSSDGARSRPSSPPPSSYGSGGSSRPDGGSSASSRSQSSREQGSSARGSADRGSRSRDGGADRGAARTRSGGDPDRH